MIFIRSVGLSPRRASSLRMGVAAILFALAACSSSSGGGGSSSSMTTAGATATSGAASSSQPSGASQGPSSATSGHASSSSAAPGSTGRATSGASEGSSSAATSSQGSSSAATSSQGSSSESSPSDAGSDVEAGSGGDVDSGDLPSAYVNASIASGCGAPAGPLLSIGSGGQADGGTGPSPTRVADGTTTGAGQIGVSCTVADDGIGGFDFQLYASLTDASNDITAFQAMGDVSGDGGVEGVGGTFVTPGGVFMNGTCSLTFPFQPAGGAFSAGRIWAHLDCPQSTAAELDGAVVSCDASADFVFENCMTQ